MNTTVLNPPLNHQRKRSSPVPPLGRHRYVSEIENDRHSWITRDSRNDSMNISDLKSIQAEQSSDRERRNGSSPETGNRGAVQTNRLKVESKDYKEQYVF